jgi:hypothetical protein
MSVCWWSSLALWDRLHRLMQCLLQSAGACQATEVGGSVCVSQSSPFVQGFGTFNFGHSVSGGVRGAHLVAVLLRICELRTHPDVNQAPAAYRQVGQPVCNIARNMQYICLLGHCRLLRELACYG